jgi:hypothetical protein
MTSATEPNATRDLDEFVPCIFPDVPWVDRVEPEPFVRVSPACQPEPLSDICRIRRRTDEHSAIGKQGPKKGKNKFRSNMKVLQHF